MKVCFLLVNNLQCATEYIEYILYVCIYIYINIYRIYIQNIKMKLI